MLNNFDLNLPWFTTKQGMEIHAFYKWFMEDGNAAKGKNIYRALFSTLFLDIAFCIWMKQ